MYSFGQEIDGPEAYSDVNIKDMVKNKKVRFSFYRDNQLFYRTEDGFEFPCRLMMWAMPRSWPKIKPFFSCVGFANTLRPSRRQIKNRSDSRHSLLDQQNPPIHRKNLGASAVLSPMAGIRQIRPTRQPERIQTRLGWYRAAPC